MPDGITTEQEKVADLYGPKYLRESEIRRVHTLLTDHPVVMILGPLGRGKSSFLSEATQYTRERQKHGRFAHSTFFFDVHEIDRHIRLLGSERSKPEDITKTVHPILDWLDHQPQGERLQDIPPSERSILYLDAGDAFFLEHWGSEYYPAYKSPTWTPIELFKDKPDAKRGYLKEFIRRQLAQKEVIKVTASRALGKPTPTPPTGEEIEKAVDWDFYRFPKYQVFEETRDLLLSNIAQALQEGRIRVVLTDHGYSRENMRRGGEGIHRQASLYLMEKYDQIFANAYRYELPANYQVDKARLYLQRELGVNDPKLQDEIIAATGATHKLLKLAVTPQLIRTLQSTDNEEQRAEILQKATEPLRKDIEV